MKHIMKEVRRRVSVKLWRKRFWITLVVYGYHNDDLPIGYVNISRDKPKPNPKRKAKAVRR